MESPLVNQLYACFAQVLNCRYDRTNACTPGQQETPGQGRWRCGQTIAVQEAKQEFGAGYLGPSIDDRCRIEAEAKSQSSFTVYRRGSSDNRARDGARIRAQDVFSAHLLPPLCGYAVGTEGTRISVQRYAPLSGLF